MSHLSQCVGGQILSKDPKGEPAEAESFAGKQTLRQLHCQFTSATSEFAVFPECVAKGSRL